MGGRQDSLGCFSQHPVLCQERALAPAMLRQQNKAGKTRLKTHWYNCSHTEHLSESPREFSPTPREGWLTSAQVSAETLFETKTVLTDRLLDRFVSATEILLNYCWFPQKLRPAHMTNIQICSSGEMLSFSLTLLAWSFLSKSVYHTEKLLLTVQFSHLSANHLAHQHVPSCL